MSKDYVSKDACDARFTHISDDVADIKEDIKIIKVNHLAHIESNMEDIKIKFTEMNVSNSIKNKIIWAIMGSIISISVAFILKSLGVF